MREFLDDVHEHINDGHGRVQAAEKKQLPKRFYKKVGVGEQDDGFRVELDGRVTKTPGGVPVLVPSLELAQLMAAEWQAQAQFIDARTMGMVRLINSATEGGVKSTEALREEVIKYAGNDLLLYRAETPRELVKLQERHWDAVLIDLARYFSVEFKPAIGVIHCNQPENTLARLAQSLVGADHFVLSALVSITSLTGSALLAIALRHALVDQQAGWAAAHVDEDYNAAMWGADEQALSRRQNRHSEYEIALTVLKLVDKNRP